MIPSEHPLFSAEDLEWIQNLFNDQISAIGLQLSVSEQFGSLATDHRDKIRRATASHSAWKSSVSHCRAAGGFVSFTKDQHCGFDIEEIDRVSDHVVKRICREESEFTSAPGAALLWSAKEAAYKSLRDLQQPPAISAVLIYDWKAISPGTTSLGHQEKSKQDNSEHDSSKAKDIWIFQFSSKYSESPIQGRGIALSFSGLAIAIAKVFLGEQSS